MAGAKIVVIYPTPRDAAAFERVYRDEHTPMVSRANFPGITRFVATRIIGSADGKTGLDGIDFQTRPFYTGDPWFLAASIAYYKWRDRRNV